MSNGSEQYCVESSEGSLSVSVSTCECTSWQSMRLPCRHILAVWTAWSMNFYCCRKKGCFLFVKDQQYSLVVNNCVRERCVCMCAHVCVCVFVCHSCICVLMNEPTILSYRVTPRSNSCHWFRRSWWVHVCLGVCVCLWRQNPSHTFSWCLGGYANMTG